jgi:hypothetical protein
MIMGQYAKIWDKFFANDTEKIDAVCGVNEYIIGDKILNSFNYRGTNKVSIYDTEKKKWYYDCSYRVMGNIIDIANKDKMILHDNRKKYEIYEQVSNG